MYYGVAHKPFYFVDHVHELIPYLLSRQAVNCELVLYCEALRSTWDSILDANAIV
jgi:hypothetical protein